MRKKIYGELKFKPRFTYDKKAKAVYYYIMDGKIHNTLEVDEGIFLDLTKTGQLVGIEILNPRKRYKGRFI